MRMIRHTIFFGMTASSLIGLWACTSCAPFVAVSDDKVVIHGGIASKTDGFSGKVKTKGGSTVAWSIVNTDSTAVPGKALDTITGLGLAKYAFKTADSNNAKEVSVNRDNLSAQTQQLQITKDAEAKAGQQANFKNLTDQGTFATGQALPTPH